jgi:excisionase family DNA binding protein
MPDFITAQELAQRWQVSEKTIRDLVKRGEITATIIASRYRFAPEDVQKFEEANRYRYQDLSANPYVA